MFKLLLVIVLSGTVNSSKILIVFNHFGRSHYIQGKSLGHGLAKAGHDVTLVSPFQSAETVKGYKEIVLNELLENIGINTNFVTNPNINPLLIQAGLNKLFENYVERTLNHTKVQTLLKSGEKFDVIILEDMYNSALRTLAWHFDAPLIIFSPFTPTTHVIELAGVPSPPSYVPNIWTGYSNRMTFWERSMNGLIAVYERMTLYFMMYPTQDRIIRKFFPGSPDVESLNKNISLFLINAHESINPALPAVPNMVNILGFHLKTKNQLPKHLQEFMDGAKDGVIFFSFGSFVNPSGMDPKTKGAFLKTLGKLKQKVLWKTDEETVAGKPANIMLGKWLPQEDILAHPNCKLFITHSGFVSTIETMYHGVPVLAVPLAGDQDLNAARMVELGVGLSIKYADITEETLDHLINELLNNVKYRQNMKKRSQLIKDRPVHPMDLAVYWVEYVIRHRDLSHLRVAGLGLRWYQYLLLDVVFVWSSFAVTVISLIYFIIKSLLGCCRRRNKLKTN